MTSNLIEAMSWRFVTEFIRRFPSKFTLIQSHPGGGQYDCLSVMTAERNSRRVLDVNRVGGLHVFVDMRSGNQQDESWPDWLDYMCKGSAKLLLDEVTQAVGLPIPPKNPPSTPEIITYRFVSDFLTHSIGTIHNWRCINGFLDTSGYGGGAINDLFRRFPNLSSIPHETLSPTLPQEYWFFCKNNNPLLCIDKRTKIYRNDGSSYNLLEMYHKSRRIWPLIFESASDLLP
jgi:hypothetical protein